MSNTSSNVCDFLYMNDVTETIIKINHDNLQVSAELQSYVEDIILSSLTQIDSKDLSENRINQAIFLMFAQGVKSFNSSLILATNGYYTNAVMCIRNCLETLVNIKYILIEPNKSITRADKYLTKAGRWTYDKINERAYKSLDRPLYEVYKILSNYSHSNLMGTGQNITTDNEISIYPSEEKSGGTIDLINAVYFELVKFIAEYYRISSERLDGIRLSEASKKMLEMFKAERDILSFFSNLFKDAGMTGENIVSIVNEYKKHVINKSKNTPKKRRKK